MCSNITCALVFNLIHIFFTDEEPMTFFSKGKRKNKNKWTDMVYKENKIRNDNMSSLQTAATTEILPVGIV